MNFDDSIFLSIKPPIILNCLKHHKGFIQSQISNLIQNPAEAMTILSAQTLAIGAHS